MDPLHPKELRVLCFGDSLTEGYTDGGYSFFPYADYMHAPLKQTFRSTNITIDVEAHSGDFVTGRQGRFLLRLESKCLASSATPYDWIICLGGTNDLGLGTQPEEIYEGLKKCYRTALQTGAKVLALNVLETEYTGKTLIQRRNQLNSLIANHEDEWWYFMDICSKIPYYSMDEKKREVIWNDGLHLGKEGYKLMGSLIAARLIEILSDGERY